MRFLPGTVVGVLASALLALGCDSPRLPSERASPAFVRPEYRPGTLSLAEKAALFERELEERHLSPEGVVLYSISLRDRRRRPSHYGNLADAAYWTGCALSAEAFRWAATGHRDALDRASQLAQGLRLLLRVSGVPGLLARTIDPDPNERVRRGELGDWFHAAPPYERYWVKGDVSKDQYCGVTFGYATAYDLLPNGDTRDAIREDLGEIARFLDRNDLTIRDSAGRPTTYSGLEAWLGPVPLGPNALIALAVFKSASRATGDAALDSRYQRLVKERYPEAAEYAKFQAFGKTNHSNDLMSMVSFYTVLRLETDSNVREPLCSGLERMWTAVRNEHNALFTSIRCALLGADLAALADAVDTLNRFPETKRVYPVDNWGREDIPLSPFTNRKGNPKAAVALPIEQRPMSSFYWKSDPYELQGDLDADGDQEYAGVDYLLAYWMSRYHRLPGFEQAAGNAGGAGQ